MLLVFHLDKNAPPLISYGAHFKLPLSWNLKCELDRETFETVKH